MIKLPRLAYRALWARPVKSVLERVPRVRRIYHGWSRRHPYDLAHGVDTSGAIGTAEHAPDAAAASEIVEYAGSQPSIVRAALASLPDHDRYTFVDLGCGKGRPLLVASEFPFLRLVGVEIAKELADIARGNADIIARWHPRRTPVEIQVGDATAVVPVSERVVYFMYHPFSGALFAALIANLERQLDGGLQHAFIVYYNPVVGEVIDRSPRFERWRAITVSYAANELGYGPDLSDSVVIW